MLAAGRSADVIVIGAGVIGLSTALELLHAGLRVTVLERAAVGRGGASWAGGGILAPLDPADADAATLPILHDSLAMYADWCARLQDLSAIDPEYRVSGLQVFGVAAEADRWRAFGRSCGLRVDDAGSLSGSVVARQPTAVLPTVAQVRSPRLLRALAAAVRRVGGRIVEGEAVQGLQGDVRVTGIVTRRQVYSASVVVLAGGAWSAQIEASAQVRPVRGEMLLLQGSPGDLRHILLEQGRYLIPRADGAIVAGSTLVDAGFDDRCTAQARRDILASVERLAPGLAQRPVLAHWAGLRPAPRGTGPQIEWVASRPGLLLNCGHYRLGITLAPGSARRATQMIVATDPARHRVPGVDPPSGA